MNYPLDYAFTLDEMEYFWSYCGCEFIINDGHLVDFAKTKKIKVRLWAIDRYGDEELYDVYDYNTSEEKNYADLMAISVRDVEHVKTRLEIFEI